MQDTDDSRQSKTPTRDMDAQGVENYRKKLLYRSWHRGTREMDMIMGTFADRNLAQFGVEDLAIYEDILTENDPDLYDWISGRTALPENKDNRVMRLLLAHDPSGRRVSKTAP